MRSRKNWSRGGKIALTIWVGFGLMLAAMLAPEWNRQFTQETRPGHSRQTVPTTLHELPVAIHPPLPAPFDGRKAKPVALAPG